MLPFPSVEHVPHQLGFSAIGCNSQLQTITIRNFEWLISWPRVVDFFDSKLAHELFLLVMAGHSVSEPCLKKGWTLLDSDG